MLLPLLVASCSVNESKIEEPVGEGAISFDAEQVQSDSRSATRGVAINDIDDVESIMVYSFLSNPAADVTACYIDHREAKQSAAGLWNFSPACYYPLSESLDFLAYTPKANATSGDDNNGISQSLDFDNKAVVIDYNMPLDGRNLPDLLVADPQTDRNRVDKLEMMSFSHALTQVSLSAKVGSSTDKNRYVITRFTLHDITTGAELNYSVDGGMGEWTSTKEGSYITSDMLPDPALGETQVKLNKNYKSIMTNGHTLMMIPQAIEAKAERPTIQLTIYDTRDDVTYRTGRLSLVSPDAAGWLPGKHVNLQFEFNVDADNVVIPMSFTAKLLPWEEIEIDEEIDANIYSYLSKAVLSPSDNEVTLYTNGELLEVASGGMIAASTFSKSGDGSYTIHIDNLAVGDGIISVKIQNSQGKTITKIFNVIVK